MNKPLPRYEADRYVFRWPDEQVDIAMQRLHEARTGDLTAEVEVRCSRDVPNGLLHRAKLNLISTRSRSDVIRALGNRIPESQIDWSAAIEMACFLTIDQWRMGEPVIDLRTVEPRVGSRFLLEPYVEQAGATVLFADGGCIGGDTLIQGPGWSEHADTLCRTGEPIVVWALSDRGPVPALATPPHVAGHRELYRFELASGRRIEVTGEHRFLTPAGWAAAASCRVGARLAICDPCQLQTSRGDDRRASPGDGRHCAQTPADCWDRYAPAGRRCDQRPRLEAGSARVLFPSRGGARGHSPLSSRRGDPPPSARYSHAYQRSGHRARSGYVSDALLQAAAGFHAGSWHSVRPVVSNRVLRPSQRVSDVGMPIRGSYRSAGAAAGAQSLAYTIPPSTLYYDTVISVSYVGERPYYDLQVPDYENYLANGIWHHNSGKSVFALGIAASIASGKRVVGGVPAEARRVLYLDWESDAETHAERLGALCIGAGLCKADVPVLYRRQAASLAEAAPHLRRIIAEEAIGFVIVDSLGAARGGEPESADATIRLFNAARTLGPPWIGVDHVTKNGGDGQPKPFGSVYTHNLARLTWSLEKVEDAGNGHLMIALTNQKANNGRPLGRRGYDVEFRSDTDDRMTFAQYQAKDVREMPTLFARLGQPQQIAEVLRQNRSSMYVEDIARCLEADGISLKTDQIRTVLNRYKRQFVSIPEGLKTRWGLAVHDA